MARHKSLSDTDCLDRLLDLVLRTGPDGLTFAKAAEASGLSPASLVQRFSNRERMVERVLLHAWDRLDAETAKADAEEPVTPGGTISILLRLAPAETAGRDATDGLLLLREDLRNPVLRARGAAWSSRLAQALGRRLAADPVRAERLGLRMVALWQGAQILGAFHGDQPGTGPVAGMLADWLADIGADREAG